MPCGPSSIEYDYEKEAMRISIWKYFAISFVCLLFIIYLFIYYYYLFIFLGGGGWVGPFDKSFKPNRKVCLFHFRLGEHGRRSDESTRFPPMWPWLDSQTWCMSRGLSLLLVLVLVPKVFLRVLRFSSPHSL